MEPSLNSAHRPHVQICWVQGQGMNVSILPNCLLHLIYTLRISIFVIFRQYLWVDEKGKKSRLSAPQYIDYIMTYVQKTINDESTFPTKHGKYLQNILKQIQKHQKKSSHDFEFIANFREIIFNCKLVSRYYF